MKHIKRKDSFIRSITISGAGFLLLMVIILTAVWHNTQETLEDTASATLSQAIEISNHEIEEILKANEQALSSVLTNNDVIRAFEKGDEVKRATAAQSMLQILKNAGIASSDVGTLIFYDLVGENYITRTSSDLKYSEIKLVEDRIKELNREYPGNMPSVWFSQKIGDRTYLLRLYKNEKRMIGALVSVDNCLRASQSNETVGYCLTDPEGNVLAVSGESSLYENADLSVLNRQAVWSRGHSHYYMGRDCERGDYRLFVSMTRARVYGGFQTLQAVILILVFGAVIMLISIILYTRGVVYRPLTELLAAMKKIEDGDLSCRLPKDAKTEEFTRINTSFDRMVDTIVNLRMRSYEERIQFDEATLKYVQLQIKPHFFLNALTTIHSMSLQDRNEDIREYIERLSRNVRYLFKSGLHTVPLSEEIEHAGDYIAMQEILYPGCVFDFIDIDEEVRDFPVPQLIVHTILENIYKHAVRVDGLTSILISASLTDRDGLSMCHIQIEDDGPGYPEEFLEQFGNGDVKVKENGHGVGLWNLKKTLSLMYRQDDLIEFSNKEAGGSRVDIYVPRRAKRQSSVWKLS